MAGPALGAGLVTCCLLAASLLSETRAGDGVPVAAGPDPAAIALTAATVIPAMPAPPTTAPPTAPTTAPPTTGPSTTGGSTTAPPTTAASTITGGPPLGVEAATPATWGGRLPQGALDVGPTAARPVAVRIDARQIEAPVIEAGTTEDAQLELPADAVTVAWYRDGPIPGASGSALLAAHVDFRGKKGVFFDLERFEPGTQIDVDMSDGSVRSFVTAGPAVRYPKWQLPLDQVFRRGGEPVLTLVTCGGRFDASRHSYEDNTVVVAVPVAPGG